MHVVPLAEQEFCDPGWEVNDFLCAPEHILNGRDKLQHLRIFLVIEVPKADLIQNSADGWNRRVNDGNTDHFENGKGAEVYSL